MRSYDFTILTTVTSSPGVPLWSSFANDVDSFTEASKICDANPLCRYFWWDSDEKQAEFCQAAQFHMFSDSDVISGEHYDRVINNLDERSDAFLQAGGGGGNASSGKVGYAAMKEYNQDYKEKWADYLDSERKRRGGKGTGDDDPNDPDAADAAREAQEHKLSNVLKEGNAGSAGTASTLLLTNAKAGCSKIIKGPIPNVFETRDAELMCAREPKCTHW
jgi:hypothetical protein